jgi:uncharacterized repeat protein (TIGR02543 family)
MTLRVAAYYRIVEPHFLYHRECYDLLNSTESNGYTFTGWTGTDLTQAMLTLSIPTGSTGNRSYTANWTANTYDIELNTNGGQVSGGTILVHTYGQQTLLPDATTTSKIGATFEGWYEAADLSGSPVSFIAATSIWSGNRTFYAKWSLVDYSITYTGLYSTTHSNPGGYTYGQSITLSNPTDRLGYNFTGWYVDDVKVTTVNTWRPKILSSKPDGASPLHHYVLLEQRHEQRSESNGIYSGRYGVLS